MLDLLDMCTQDKPYKFQSGKTKTHTSMKQKLSKEIQKPQQAQSNKEKQPSYEEINDEINYK